MVFAPNSFVYDKLDGGVYMVLAIDGAVNDRGEHRYRVRYVNKTLRDMRVVEKSINGFGLREATNAEIRSFIDTVLRMESLIQPLLAHSRSEMVGREGLLDDEGYFR